MVEFGGWEMPISYPSGTIKEHMACREGCVIFDVSHLGTVNLAGPGSFETLQAQLTNDLKKIGPKRAQYTHLLDPEDGSVLDDIIVWWVDDEVFDVMPNASNTISVLDAIGGEDVTSSRAVIAVQGPLARSMAEKVVPGSSQIGRFRVDRLSWQGHDITVAGTGYTGEDGLEMAVPTNVAKDIWEDLVVHGALPAGLGARDTLRLEAGLPLHGHELGPGITPLQAGLEWVVAWNKGVFRGREPLEQEKSRGIRRKLIGMKSKTRKPPRANSYIYTSRDLTQSTLVGKVTSGNFSPILGTGIAIGLIDVPAFDATELYVDERGVPLECNVVRLPFISKKVQ